MGGESEGCIFVSIFVLNCIFVIVIVILYLLLILYLLQRLTYTVSLDYH